MTTPALNDDLVREVATELLAHGEFSHISANNRPNAELAAKAILEIVGRHQAKEIEALRSALEVAKRTIIEGGSGGVTCTVWVPYDVSPNETLVDHIDAVLARTALTGA